VLGNHLGMGNRAKEKLQANSESTKCNAISIYNNKIIYYTIAGGTIQYGESRIIPDTIYLKPYCNNTIQSRSYYGTPT